MAPSLLMSSHSGFHPAEALGLAQQAPAVLHSHPKEYSRSLLGTLSTSRESGESWMVYENLLLACLRTGDNTAAHECLARLVRRFGDTNERIMALKGLVMEAEANDSTALAEVLNEYDSILGENSANVPIAKRRVVVLRALGRVPDAITALSALLDTSPTDSEAWSELADMYVSQGLYPQAIFALEEVLVLMPNAWNMHARMGEILYMAATQSRETGRVARQFGESLRCFCRSIELCDSYLRACYGLKLLSDRLLSDAPSSATDADAPALPERTTIEKLNQLATEKMAEIVRRYGAKEAGWRGYDEDEVAAARRLLDKTFTRTSK